MNELGFEIKINGEKLCRVGVESDQYVVTSIFNTIIRKGEDRAEFSIEISASDSEKGETLKWVKKTLSENDKISMEVVTGSFDAPSTRIKNDSEEYTLEKKIETFYRLKETLKGYVE